MDPITIAMGLAQFVPQIAKWITGSDKAEQIAQKAVDIAQAVTGKPSGDEAIKALQADPNLVLQYRKAVLDQKFSFQEMAVQNASDINRTMQAEAAAEHWPSEPVAAGHRVCCSNRPGRVRAYCSRRLRRRDVVRKRKAA